MGQFVNAEQNAKRAGVIFNEPIYMEKRERLGIKGTGKPDGAGFFCKGEAYDKGYIDWIEDDRKLAEYLKVLGDPTSFLKKSDIEEQINSGLVVPWEGKNYICVWTDAGT